MRPAFAHRVGQVFLGLVKPLHQLAIARRFLDRVEVGALDVLDNRDFQHFRIVKFPHDHGDLVQLRHLGRPPAPFARDDLEMPLGVRIGAHDQRLDDPLLAH